MSKELEEAAESRYGTDMDSIRGSNVYDLNTDLKRGFIEGAKWQAERMYSEEYIRIMLRELSSDLYEIDPLHSLEEWFEQYKKGGKDA